MAFDIGELVGRLKIDNKEFDKGIKEGESKFQRFGSGLGKLAATFGAGAAVALGGALLAGLSDQDVGAKIAAQLGESSASAQKYGKIAGGLYAAGWGDSLESIGETITQIQRAQLVPSSAAPAAVQHLAEQAQILSDVFGQDVQGSVRAVQQMIRTGLVPDAQTGFDLITKGIQQGDDKAGDLLDTLNEYPTELRKLGLSGQQSLGLITQGLQAGARDSDKVADALKEFSIRAVDGSTTTAAGFKLLGLSVSQVSHQIGAGGAQATAGLQTVLDRLRAIKDPVMQAQAATDLFGTQAEDLGKALFALDPSHAVAALGDFSGATEKAGKTASNTANNNLKIFERQVQQTFTNTVGGKVIPIINNVVSALSTGLGPTLGAVGKFIKENQSWLAPFAVTLGTLAGLIYGITAAMKVWGAVTKALTAAQVALDVAMDANPIGVIIIAILALAAGFAYLWTHSASFRKFWIGLWNEIWGFLKAVGAWFAGPFSNFFVQGFHWVMGFAKAFWDTIMMVYHGIADVVLWLWHTIIEPWASAVGAIFSWIGQFVTALGALWWWLANQTIIPAIQAIASVVMWLWNNAIAPAFQGIASVAMWLWNNVIMPVVNGISAAFGWLWTNGIKPAFDAIGAAASWIGGVLWGAWQWIMSGVKWLSDGIGGLFNKIGGFIAGAFNLAIGQVKAAINTLISLVNSAIGFINNDVIGTLNKVPGVSFPKVPTIPHLAGGGAVQPTPGGTPVVMGDGRQVEYGVPKSDMQAIIGQAVAAAGATGAGGTLTIVIKGDGILRGIRKEVRKKGGDPATVLVGG